MMRLGVLSSRRVGMARRLRPSVAVVARVASTTATAGGSELPPSAAQHEPLTNGSGGAAPAWQKVSADMGAPVYRVAITGGPGGGKSTAFSQLTDRLTAFGFKVYQVPEAATLLIGGGVSFALASRQHRIATQQSLMRVQKSLEDAMVGFARRQGEPSVVLCDRGLMDAKAYMRPEEWQDLLKLTGDTEEQLRDERYEVVVHMMSAAVGKPQFYTTANNRARSESVDEAAALDLAIRKAWLGSPRMKIVENTDVFSDKLQRVLSYICSQVGIPSPAGTRRFFLVHSRNDSLSSFPVPFRDFDIEYNYLQTDDMQHARLQTRIPLNSSIEAQRLHAFLQGQFQALDTGRTGLLAKDVVESCLVKLEVFEMLEAADAAAASHKSGDEAVLEGSPAPFSFYSFEAQNAEDGDGPSLAAQVVRRVHNAIQHSVDPLNGLVDWRALLTRLMHTRGKTYQYRVRYLDSAQRVEKSRVLTGREFPAMLAMRNGSLETVRKRRRIFEHNNMCFEWDTVLTPRRHGGLSIVAVEVEKPDQHVQFPPFLRPIRDVTDDERFLSSSLAVKDRTIPTESL